MLHMNSTCGMRHSCGTVQNPEAPSRVCLRLGFAILVRAFSVASFTANVYSIPSRQHELFLLGSVAPPDSKQERFLHRLAS